MVKKSFLPAFGMIIITTTILLLIGGTGLVFIIIFLEPRLGPRWLLYFFLTLTGAGISLPFVYFFQRRIAKSPVPANILIRESILFAIFLDLVLWLQIGRIVSNLIIFFLAIGLILLEFFLRMAEKATFDAINS